MEETITAEGGQVKVGYLELNAKERKMADAVLEQTKTFLVAGFKDEIAKARAEWDKETDPTTRPNLTGGTKAASDVSLKRYGAAKKSVDSSGKVSIKGGFLPPIQATPDERKAIAADFAAHVDTLQDKKTAAGVSFNVLKFPAGDIDNFSVCRWAMALERSQNTSEGTTAFAKHAPWESAYYAALESYSQTKAQGDMVSGQDGGFLAPELLDISSAA